MTSPHSPQTSLSCYNDKELPPLSGNPKVHYRVFKSPSLDIMSQNNVIHALWWHTKESYKLHHLLKHFITSYGQGLLVTGPTWEMEDHLLPIIYYWLNIFTSILYIWSLSLLHPQPESKILLLRPSQSQSRCKKISFILHYRDVTKPSRGLHRLQWCRNEPIHRCQPLNYNREAN
jgi:hypothetical protein